uniref:TIL domain-containing protein n=1 Tax=Anopheles atroparvus TaxID=41427 RepID=A0AAG5CUU1_ANOAO
MRLLAIAVLLVAAFSRCEAQSGLITTGCGVLPKCGANEVAACCEPCYSVYCFYINRNCGKNCVKACYCKLGFVRMQPNGPCVSKLQCAKGKK